MDAMAAIKQTFFQECEEQLAELEAGLLAIQDGGHDAETVNAVFRAVHSIKGGAGAFSLDDLVQFAHVFETALDHVRAGRLAPSHDVVSAMLRAADALADLVRAARDGGGVDAARCGALADALRALDPDADADADRAADESADMEALDFAPVPIDESMFDDELAMEAAPRRNLFHIRFKPKAALYAKANEAAVLLRELAGLGEATIACDASGLPLLTELDPEGAYLAWSIALATAQDEAAVRELFEFVEWDCELDIECRPAGDELDESGVAALIEKMQAAVEAELFALTPHAPQGGAAADAAVIDLGTARQQNPAPALGEAASRKPEQAAAGGPAQATIRVDLDRVDRLINLVGELVINQAMLAQRVQEAGLARASGVATGLDELEQLTREIQDSVMAIRAQPVKSVFQRMPRLVREVARDDRQAGASRHRRREHRGRQDGDRTPGRSADPYDPQCHRPWARIAGSAPRRRQAGRRPRAAVGACTAPAASSSKFPTTAPASIGPRVKADRRRARASSRPMRPCPMRRSTI